MIHHASSEVNSTPRDPNKTGPEFRYANAFNTERLIPVGMFLSNVHERTPDGSRKGFAHRAVRRQL